MSLNPSCAVPVHSHSLGELIAALTSLVQYSAQLLAGPQEAQPSPSSSPSLCRLLSLSSSLSEWLHFPTLSRFIVLLGSVVVHLAPFSIYPNLPGCSFLIPAPFHPFPLCSNGGVGSAVISEGLSRVCASVYSCNLLLFRAKENRLSCAVRQMCAYEAGCQSVNNSVNTIISPLPLDTQSSIKSKQEFVYVCLCL